MPFLIVMYFFRPIIICICKENCLVVTKRYSSGLFGRHRRRGNWVFLFRGNRFRSREVRIPDPRLGKKIVQKGRKPSPFLCCTKRPSIRRRISSLFPLKTELHKQPLLVCIFLFLSWSTYHQDDGIKIKKNLMEWLLIEDNYIAKPRSSFFFLYI